MIFYKKKRLKSKKYKVCLSHTKSPTSGALPVTLQKMQKPPQNREVFAEIGEFAI